MYELTILMPCLNEAATLAMCIDKARAFLKETGIKGEVLIADNGSNDGSPEIARAHGARVQFVGERGYGAALIGGIEAAHGTYIIMADADDSYDFSNLMPFLQKLRDGYDLVVGNRFHGGIKPGAMPLLHRYLGNPVLSWIGRLFFKSPVGDFYCGLRGIRKEAICGLGLQMTGMEFCMEIVVRSTQNNLRISEVPTTLSPDGRGRAPHLKTWQDGWRGLRFLLLFSPRWLFLYPGMALMLLGFAVLIWIGPSTSTRYILGIGFDVHTLLYGSAAMILGMQAISFAVFAKVFAVGIGLVPEDERVVKILRYVSVERGLLWGSMLLLSGLAGTFYAVMQWGLDDFRPVSASSTMRIIIPAVTAMILGAQIILGGFFLNILGLSRKR